MIPTTFVLALVIVYVTTAAIAPTPVCSARPFPLEGPLTYGETITLKLDDVFSGYNLNIQIASNTSVAKLDNKMNKISEAQGFFPEIIAQHVENKGNSWGEESYLLYSSAGSIKFSYGRIKSEFDVPDFVFNTTISTDKTMECFGAVPLLDYGVAIVDCMQTIVDHGAITLSNIFHYVNLTDGSITKKVKNSMYVKYRSVTRRRIMRFKDPHSGLEYVLRAHFADGVNKEQRGNTYLEIFSITDPYNIQIMKVIDRTYLHLNSFEIVDAKVYLGDIFVLDYFYGLYRLDILRNNDVVIMGRFPKDGFTRFSVYSDDLEEEVIVALANSHAIYEIEWSDMNQPVTTNKYSLMEHSHIKQLFINNDFVIVQSTGNATNSTNPNFEIDYTWIFTKQARTYTNAFAIINHKSEQVELDFNRASNHLYIIDENGRYLYQLKQPRVLLKLNEKTQVGSSEDLIIFATSTDPNSDKPVVCQIKTKINFVENTDMTIYTENYDTTTVYSANNPGDLHINLDNYVLGPNITYSLVNESSVNEMPQRWINKINETKLILNETLGEVIFFRTEVYPVYNGEAINYYIQNREYTTFVVQCNHNIGENSMNCRTEARYLHTSEIAAFTTAIVSRTVTETDEYYIIVFGSDLKTIRVFDFTRHKNIGNITYFGHEESQVSSLASSNGFLFVLRYFAKTIDVYKLSECSVISDCKIHFSINSEVLKHLEIDYFTPLEIITDNNHPEVIFLRCRGSVIILDIDNKERITLLGEIRSDITKRPYYRVAINKQKLILVSDPNLIDIYTLDHIYVKNEIKFERSLPLYGYEIQTTSDIEFSDFNDLLYVNAIDPIKKISTILVYRTNHAAAVALFAEIPLPKIYQRPGLEIEVSGGNVDFVNILTADKFTLYRVFESPRAIIRNVEEDYKFQLSFTNSKSNLLSQPLEIKSANFPAGFNPTPELNATLDSLKIDNTGNYTWNDRKWFTGHILSYNFSCDECGKEESKVHLKEHVDTTREFPFPALDYTETLSGGVAVLEDLFRFHINGSVNDVINLPDQKILESCNKVAATYFSDVLVSACEVRGQGVNLYITSQSSYKPWTNGPFRTEASVSRKLEIAADIVMIADTHIKPELKLRKGAVFLYALELDSDSGEQLEELEMIDESDLINTAGYTKNYVYIGNSHLVYSSIDQCYRLYVTNVEGGLFIVDFTHQLGRKSINIVSISYVDIRVLLEKNNLHMPTEASVEDVSLVDFKYNPHFNMESVVVTIKNYHNIEITLVFDDDGKLLSQILHRVYYRYGFYETINSVKARSGYVAITYIIPSSQMLNASLSRQVVAVYDSKDYEHDSEKGYSERYMLGGLQHNEIEPLMFAFNTTYDFRTNGTRIGLVVATPNSNKNFKMWEESLSRNLTLELKSSFKDQEITFTPYSDFDVKSFKMRIINPDPNPHPDNEETMIIIIIILAVLITLGFGIYIFILVKNRKKTKNQTERVSLLTESEGIRNSVEPTAGEYLPPNSLPNNESDSDSDSSSEEQLPAKKTEVISTPVEEIKKEEKQIEEIEKREQVKVFKVENGSNEARVESEPETKIEKEESEEKEKEKEQINQSEESQTTPQTNEVPKQEDIQNP